MHVGPFDEIHPFEEMMMEAHSAELMRFVEMTDGTDVLLNARILRLWRKHRVLRGQPEMPDEMSYVNRAFKRALNIVTLGRSVNAELCMARVVHLGGSEGRLGSLVSTSSLPVTTDTPVAMLAQYTDSVRRNLIAYLSVETVRELAHDLQTRRLRTPSQAAPAPACSEAPSQMAESGRGQPCPPASGRCC